MKEEPPIMHSEDDKIAPEKNKKRMVKTPAQVEALEKFYDEHKYPTEDMKARLAESIGLTEKQVSGWFCHRRLKDKKSVTSETPIPVKQERPCVVMQDRGSGLKQDSCGSTKQGEDKNFDTREVESGPKEFSATGLTYEHGNHYTGNTNHINDPSSGSSSSLRNIPNHQNVDPFDSPMSNSYMIPKVWADVMGVKRRGPSGYLKLKSRAENPAVTAVKRKLGKLFQEDGPPLGVQFDPLPPGAFESSMNQETYYPGEAVLPSSDDVARSYQNTKIGNVYDYKSSSALYNPNTGRINYKMSGGNDESDRYAHQRFIPRASIPEGSGYYPMRNSPVGSPEIPTRTEYRMMPKSGIESARIDPVLSHPRFRPNNGKVKDKQDDPRFYKYNDASARVSVKDEIENGLPNPMMRRKESRNSVDRGQLGQIIKDGKMYIDRRVVDDDDDFPPPKRVKEEFPPQLQKQMSAAFENPPQAFRGIRSLEASCGFSEDEESAETSSWVE